MEQYSQEVLDLWCRWCIARRTFVPIRDWVGFCHPPEIWEALARSREKARR